MSEAPFRIVPAGEGEALWFAGAHQVVKHPGDWSEGQFSFVEVTVQRGRATGLHVDPSDETFYVLEGELLFHVDGVEHAAGPGDTVSLRKGTPHAFVATSELAKFVVMNTPGTHDRFFRDGGEPATHQDFESAPAPDHERMEASCRKHGIEMLGPPPFSALGVAG
ncbi:MAG: cupin domain-containing protein [Actinobacteria bacterium]|nr:cupin domain-containing protein [Actinomycetota bacterium]